MPRYPLRRLGQAGQPLYAEPHFQGVSADQGGVDYYAELVLATLMESQISADDLVGDGVWHGGSCLEGPTGGAATHLD